MSAPIPFAVSSISGPVTTDVTTSAVWAPEMLVSMAASVTPLPMPAMMSAPPVPHVNAAIHERIDGVNRANHAKKTRPTRALTLEAPTASAAVEPAAPSIAPINSWARAGMLRMINTIELTVSAVVDRRAGCV